MRELDIQGGMPVTLNNLFLHAHTLLFTLSPQAAQREHLSKLEARPKSSAGPRSSAPESKRKV